MKYLELVFRPKKIWKAFLLLDITINITHTKWKASIYNLGLLYIKWILNLNVYFELCEKLPLLSTLVHSPWSIQTFSSSGTILPVVHLKIGEVHFSRGTYNTTHLICGERREEANFFVKKTFFLLYYFNGGFIMLCLSIDPSTYRSSRFFCR